MSVQLFDIVPVTYKGVVQASKSGAEAVAGPLATLRLLAAEAPSSLLSLTDWPVLQDTLLSLMGAGSLPSNPASPAAWPSLGATQSEQAVPGPVICRDATACLASCGMHDAEVARTFLDVALRAALGHPSELVWQAALNLLPGVMSAWPQVGSLPAEQGGMLFDERGVIVHGGDLQRSARKSGPILSAAKVISTSWGIGGQCADTHRVRRLAQLEASMFPFTTCRLAHMQNQ